MCQSCKHQLSDGSQCGKLAHRPSAYKECNLTYCSAECLTGGNEKWLGEQASGFVPTRREQATLPKAKAKAAAKGKGDGKDAGKDVGKDEGKGMSKAKGATMMASRIGQTGTLGNTRLPCLNAKILVPTACFLQSDLMAPLLTTLGDITRNKLRTTGDALEWDGNLKRDMFKKRTVWERFTKEGGHCDPVYARIFATLFDLKNIIMRDWMVYFVVIKVEPFLPSLKDMGTDPEYEPSTNFKKPAEGPGAYNLPLFEAALLDDRDPEKDFLCNNAVSPALNKQVFRYCGLIELELKRRRDACSEVCRKETAAPPLPRPTANGLCAPLQLG